MIEIYHHGSRIASHPRLNGVVNQYSTMEDHMPDHHKPVSYTHLDVYKRQVLYCLVARI